MPSMNSVLLWAVIYCAVANVLSQNYTGRECIDNPTGTVSLNVDVRGVPGPQGPQGPQGIAGPTGNVGPKGDRGNKGEKGEIGDSGPIGPKGMLGIKGSKGQKGIRGIEGQQGPPGVSGQEGPTGPRGFPGSDGTRGSTGPTGPPGVRGPQGEPGDTVLSLEEFERVTAGLYATVVEKMNSSLLHLETQNEILENELKAMNATMQECCLKSTKCGIHGEWKRVGYMNTAMGDLCPSALRTVSSTIHRKTACGRKLSRGGCTSIPIPVQISYGKVCGIVKGYQERTPDAFGREVGGSSGIDAPYVDGISITQGRPRTHLWTYAAGVSETGGVTAHRCPCAGGPSGKVPAFVGSNYYCESGYYPGRSGGSVAWDDPLWDGLNCVAPNSRSCCNRYSWFYRNLPISTKDIELRICADVGIYNEDILVESYEFWVM